MNYRHRSAPVSTLRERLQQRLAEKNSWEAGDDYIPEDAEAAPRAFFLTAAIKEMHRYLLIKITVAVVIVFAAAFMIWGGHAWGRPLLQALRFAVEWDIDPGSLTEKAVPAFRLLWNNKGAPFTGGAGGGLPFTGSLKSGYGLRTDPAAGRDQMHYGVDLAASEGTAVRAVYGGRVDRVDPVPGGSDLCTVVVDAGSGWSMVYQGLAAAEVKTGDNVEPGVRLGKLGPPSLYDLSHLHFELRCNGRPAAPPEDWVARFTGDTAL